MGRSLGVPQYRFSVPPIGVRGGPGTGPTTSRTQQRDPA